MGPYSVPIKLLKSRSKSASESLTLIVNDSFNKGIYSNKLKTAKVVALHKKGASDNPTNYRPISLLSIFSKIIGKLMYERLNEFLEINNVIHSLQFGFRRKHSTAHALISLTERIKQTIDDGNYDCGIFIDLKKAFDTVNRLILFKKLEHYSIRGIPLEWFKSYLNNRKQYVSVCGNISETLEITLECHKALCWGLYCFIVH